MLVLVNEDGTDREDREGEEIVKTIRRKSRGGSTSVSQKKNMI